MAAAEEQLEEAAWQQLATAASESVRPYSCWQQYRYQQVTKTADIFTCLFQIFVFQLKNIFIFFSPQDVRSVRQYQASIQDGRRESLQSTINSTKQQQLLETASLARGSYPPRLPTVGSGCGQQQLSQKDCCRRFGLDRGTWQAGLLNKCKLAEECRAASEKVQSSSFQSFVYFLKSYLTWR